MNEFEWRFFGWKNSSFKIVIGGSFMCLTMLIFWWMYQNYYYINPFVPNDSALSGTQLYGKNMEGELIGMCKFFLTEIGVVLIVLLPFSFRNNYWVRVLILQFLYGFWFFAMFIGAMHGSGLFGINLVGVLGINLLLFVLLVTTFIADLQNKSRLKNLWNNRNRHQTNN